MHKRGIARDKGIALDRAESKRTYDSDGKLKIKDCHLTMEQVAGYYGSEVPNFKALGLEPNRLYKFYRPQNELEKAIASFSGIPLLNDHHDTEVGTLDNDVIVGYIVSEPYFESPFLKADVAVHDKEAINKLENNIQRELSPQYYWTPDMTVGEFNGERYDGVMRELEALNVALVDKARAGSANKVSDNEPNINGGKGMTIAEELAALMAKVNDASPEEKEAFEAKFKEHQGGEIGDIKLELKGLKDAIAELVKGKKPASDEGDDASTADDEAEKEPAKDAELEALKKKVADMEACKKADDEKAEAQEITKDVIGKAADSATALDIYTLAAKELKVSDDEFKRAKANDSLPFLIKKSIEVDQIKKQHQSKANDSIEFGGDDYESGMAKILGGAK